MNSFIISLLQWNDWVILHNWPSFVLKYTDKISFERDTKYSRFNTLQIIRKWLVMLVKKSSIVCESFGVGNCRFRRKMNYIL